MSSLGFVVSVVVSVAAGATPARPAIGRARPIASAPLHPALQLRPVASPVLVASAALPAEARSISAMWGVCGFLSILASAIRRLAPIAIQPFARRDLTVLQWCLFGCSIFGFAYIEGYGAFQKKFSPMVVRRAMTLTCAGAAGAHRLFAPFYAMGLFHASKKRRIISWSVSLSVFMLVGLIKRLPYPWRSIVDAGVCSGLAWGGLSIVAIYLRAVFGTPPDVDPELPSVS